MVYDMFIPNNIFVQAYATKYTAIQKMRQQGHRKEETVWTSQHSYRNLIEETY